MVEVFLFDLGKTIASKNVDVQVYNYCIGEVSLYITHYFMYLCVHFIIALDFIAPSLHYGEVLSQNKVPAPIW